MEVDSKQAGETLIGYSSAQRLSPETDANKSVKSELESWDQTGDVNTPMGRYDGSSSYHLGGSKEQEGIEYSSALTKNSKEESTEKYDIETSINNGETDETEAKANEKAEEKIKAEVGVFKESAKDENPIYIPKKEVVGEIKINESSRTPLPKRVRNVARDLEVLAQVTASSPQLTSVINGAKKEFRTTPRVVRSKREIQTEYIQRKRGRVREGRKRGGSKKSGALKLGSETDDGQDESTQSEDEASFIRRSCKAKRITRSYLQDNVLEVESENEWNQNRGYKNNDDQGHSGMREMMSPTPLYRRSNTESRQIYPVPNLERERVNAESNVQGISTPLSRYRRPGSEFLAGGEHIPGTMPGSTTRGLLRKTVAVGSYRGGYPEEHMASPRSFVDHRVRYTSSETRRKVVGNRMVTARYVPPMTVAGRNTNINTNIYVPGNAITSNRYPHIDQIEKRLDRNLESSGETTETDEECVNLTPFSPPSYRMRRNINTKGEIGGATDIGSGSGENGKEPMSARASRKSLSSGQRYFNQSILDSQIKKLGETKRETIGGGCGGDTTETDEDQSQPDVHNHHAIKHSYSLDKKNERNDSNSCRKHNSLKTLSNLSAQELKMFYETSKNNPFG
ncbi:hypothetical protein AX774_g389 [Zancudomyces culisetae]|uniref:Uncharacterized protein n=1 Tax=Zancudomyces culisetae TaxID=1213189 RepID=A0A1R1PJP7_ZANCU|nr:hypothetical protein AX774_g5350 [Zancudomyces culisetae]OMH86040.1 hypothetical protein AX774_g389 [Zancudomyces culisetae]|eukprot:OMH81195.1 hypothetical protein AX774_g5350 [Zancudomyces culisetae]